MLNLHRIGQRVVNYFNGQNSVPANTTTKGEMRTADEVLRIAENLQGFNKCCYLVGQDIANEVVRVNYDVAYGLAQGPENKLRENMETTLTRECVKIDQARQHLHEIYEEAKLGFKTLREEACLLTPKQYGSTSEHTDCKNAACWIMFNSKTESANKLHNATSFEKNSEDKIEGIINDVLKNDISFDMKSLARLHSALAPEVSSEDIKYGRPTISEAKYPSSAGSIFLLNYALEIAKKLDHQSKEKSLDVAGFLFGVIIRSHAFVDGNGRLARTVYACVLIKNGIPFRAPSFEAENRIHRLDND